MIGNIQRTKVFISYSHDDWRFLKRLRVFLKPKVRDGCIESWDDTQLTAGSDWRVKIREALDSARVAVLLVSGDFFASDFIAENELPPLLEAAQKDHAVILPVIVGPVDYNQSKLSRFQAVNDPKRPLGKLRTKPERDEVWLKVVRDIEKALNGTEPATTRTADEARRQTPERASVKPQENREPEISLSSVSPVETDEGDIAVAEGGTAGTSITRPFVQPQFGTRELESVYELDRSQAVELVAIALIGLISLVLFIAFTIDPVNVAHNLGPGTHCMSCALVVDYAFWCS